MQIVQGKNKGKYVCNHANVALQARMIEQLVPPEELENVLTKDQKKSLRSG